MNRNHKKKTHQLTIYRVPIDLHRFGHRLGEIRRSISAQTSRKRKERSALKTDIWIWIVSGRSAAPTWWVRASAGRTRTSRQRTAPHREQQRTTQPGGERRRWPELPFNGPNSGPNSGPITGTVTILQLPRRITCDNDGASAFFIRLPFKPIQPVKI